MNENLSDENETDDSETDVIESKDERPVGHVKSNVTDSSDTSGPQEEESGDAKNEEEARKTPFFVIVVGFFLTILVITCLQVDDWSRDWTTNYAETDSNAEEIDMRPVETELSVTQLSQLVNEVMSDTTRWTVSETKEINKDLFEVELVHKTFWFGFKDDVKVRIGIHENGTIMNVFSKSRIGKGDLGQNPRNIKELVSIIRAELSNRKKLSNQKPSK